MIFSVKVPQIMKILRAGKGDGISILAVTGELCAVSFSMAYSYVNQHPFR